MGTKVIKEILTFKVFIFLFLTSFLISPLFAQNNPKDYKIKIEFDDKIKEILKDGQEKHLSLANKIKGNWEKIIRTQLLPDYFNNLELDKNDPKRLPSCVIEAMNELLSKKEIKFKFSVINYTNLQNMFNATDESTGALPISEAQALGDHDPKTFEITIYGLYKEMYYYKKKDWQQGKGHCTASLLFHELIHQALHNAKNDKDLNEKFCVKIESTDEIDCFDPKTGEKYTYNAKRCTNKENMDWDEGIAEDCMLKPFPIPCGYPAYKEKYRVREIGKDQYYPNGARKFNPPGEDCSEDLCKKPDETCDDNCIKKEECPQKPPDHQDDNFSFSTGSEVNEYKLAPEALIYKGGFYHEAVNLFGGLLWDGENSAEELLKISKTLIIPSGAMYSREDDTTLKNILEEYVRRGGSLIILCQQYGIACGPIGICEQKRKKVIFLVDFGTIICDNFESGFNIQTGLSVQAENATKHSNLHRYNRC